MLSGHLTRLGQEASLDWWLQEGNQYWWLEQISMTHISCFWRKLDEKLENGQPLFGVIWVLEPSLNDIIDAAPAPGHSGLLLPEWQSAQCSLCCFGRQPFPGPPLGLNSVLEWRSPSWNVCLPQPAWCSSSSR